jgi:ParB family chromosome partitioning protein
VNKQEKQAAKDKAKNVLQSLSDPVNNLSNDTENNMIAIDLLTPYENHPFKLYDDDRLVDMIRSIEEMGVLLPIIVRLVGDKYQILSGHNRVNAAKQAGLTEIPAIIKTNLSDDEARLIVTETNLIQRSFADLSHSERAVSLKMHMDAIKSQGKRNDLINEINELLNIDKTDENGTCVQVEHKLKSRDKTADKYGLSNTNVFRYIRLSNLKDGLLNLVDSGEISFVSAVSLSYLSEEMQSYLDSFLSDKKNNVNYKINMKKAEHLRELFENGKLDEERMEKVLKGEYDTKLNELKSPTSFRLKNKILKKYFPGWRLNDVEEEIIKAIEFYRQRNK